jgi:hypothetical protein
LLKLDKGEQVNINNSDARKSIYVKATYTFTFSGLRLPN